ncbi:Uncharacterized protein HZ326_7496 [Fusarium oxysporum f. sp. albedinis]|nr:Uncharacterized protein HZ326_7496 [Fusarium oxysporum f. sp. albedinis]
MDLSQSGLKLNLARGSIARMVQRPLPLARTATYSGVNEDDRPVLINWQQNGASACRCRAWALEMIDRPQPDP